MPTEQEIKQSYQDIKDKRSKSVYKGPTLYRGHEINQKHSIRRVSRTLLSYLDQSQFCQLQIIGLPGSGKSTLAENIITDLVEMAKKQNDQVYNVHWAYADDLRNLGQYIDNLSKGNNHIVVFDDISKALDKLSGTEQAEVFEHMTTTRHTTGGNLCFMSLFHYSFAQLKSLRSQAVITIYTSASLVEKNVIAQQLGGDYAARMKLKTFVKIYQDAFSKKKFELSLSPNITKEFKTGEPFRPCFVINLSQAHIGLFMELRGLYGPTKNAGKFHVGSDALIKNVVKTYGKDGELALKLLCLSKGHPNAMRNDFVYAWKFVIDNIVKKYKINYPEMAKILGGNQKRMYRKRKEEKQLVEKIQSESENV